MEPNATIAHIWMAYAYEAKGDFSHAIDHFEKCELFSGTAAETTASFAALRQGYRESGEKGYWQGRLDQSKAWKRYFLVARSYAHLDEKRQALDWLERAAAEQSDVAIWFKFDARYHYSNLRSESWFIALLRRIGLDK